MRRENSKFNAAFASYAGSKLYNNDYFGSAELDGFACYAIADGLESGDVESEGARIAVQAAISSFYEKPSLSAGALKRYINAAHEALLKNAAHKSLRASITIVVTDYQSARFAWVGNARFYLYRSGRVIHQTLDHSLAQQMVAKGDLTLDKIARHEERGNLSRYAGQKGSLASQVSKKIKLQDGDIFAMLTRGIWENCDTRDVWAALESAENDPKLVLDGLENLLLAPGPEDLDNYTAAAVFIDKIYINPNKGKKLKRALLITIPLLTVAVIIACTLYIQKNRNDAKRQEMNNAYVNAVEYIGDENFSRAYTELSTAIRLAGELKDVDFTGKVDVWRKLVDAIQNADYMFTAGDYNGAQDSYLIAKDRCRYTDNAGMAYVERKLTAVSGYISVRDLIALGDTLASTNSFLSAESKYLDARQMASGINDAEGRQMAMEALDALYQAQDRADAVLDDIAAEQDRARKEAVEMEASADLALAEKDLNRARLFYDMAKDRFAGIDDVFSVARINGKLQTLTTAMSQNQAQEDEAEGYVEEGDKLFDADKYIDAKVKYILARNIYSRLQNDAALRAVIAKIDSCDLRLGFANQ